MSAADAIRLPLPVIRATGDARSRWWRVWPWAAALSSGGLLVFCLEPWNQEWLCWLALTPLLAAVWFAPNASPSPHTANPSTSLERELPSRLMRQQRQGWARWFLLITPLFTTVWFFPAKLPSPDSAGAPVNRLRRFRAWLGRCWRQRVVRCFLLGYLCGLVYIWGAFYWLTTVTVPGWFILGPYMACYPALWSVFVGTLAWPGPLATPAATGTSWRGERTGGSGLFVWNPLPASGSPLLRSRWNLWFAFLAAAAWVGLEWVRGWLFSGFGWNDLGIALHDNLPLLQIAEWTGVGGLSFVAAFVNVIAVATVARFFLEVRAHRVRPHFDFTLTLAGLMVLIAFGVRTLKHSHDEIAKPGAAIPLRVAAVQAAIPQDEKWNAARADGIIKTYEDLTATALGTRPQLLLWPEAATPYGMYDGRGQTMQTTFGVANNGKCSLLFGTLDFDFGADGRSQADYNAAMMVTPGSKQVQVYRKIHLVPYGEYVPFRKSFPPIAWIVGDQVPDDFAFGHEPTVFEMSDPEVRAAPLICFEDALGELTRQPVLQGAQLLVNVTNDAWFQRTAASRQHFNEAVFRTVENRRPLVRCANTGVTAFVDCDGRVTQLLRQPDGTIFGQGILAGVVDVPTQGFLTFYTRHGDVFSTACATAAGLAAFLTGWRKLRRVKIRRRIRGPQEAGAT